MLKWWKSLFADMQDDAPVTWMDKAEPETTAVIVPKGVVPVILPIRNISEPVISFVECMKENPKRFSFGKVYPTMERCYYTLRDKVTKQEFRFKREWRYAGDFLSYREAYYYPIDEDWLTQDEIQYLNRSLQALADAKDQRLRVLKHNRRREQLKKIYCKEEVSA